MGPNNETQNKMSNSHTLTHFLFGAAHIPVGHPQDVGFGAGREPVGGLAHVVAAFEDRHDASAADVVGHLLDQVGHPVEIFRFQAQLPPDEVGRRAVETGTDEDDVRAEVPQRADDHVGEGRPEAAPSAGFARPRQGVARAHLLRCKI